MPYNYLPEKSQQKSASRNEALFPNVITGVGQTFGAPSKSIFIYNVAPLEHSVSRPPNHPHLLIRACPAGDDYILTGSIEHPFPQIEYDANENRRIEYVNGYREATAMLSPLNPGTDQNFDAPDALNRGGNLNNYGVFWSENNPPLRQELDAARHRMERTFKEELAELAQIEAKNPDEARSRANNISHGAANYYGQSTSWHRSDLVPKTDAGKVPCPNCNEQISPGAAVCRHCDAILDEEKARKFFPDRFKAGPGRPPRHEEAA